MQSLSFFISLNKGLVEVVNLALEELGLELGAAATVAELVVLFAAHRLGLVLVNL